MALCDNNRMSPLSELYWSLLKPSSVIFLLLLLSLLSLWLRAHRFARTLLAISLLLAAVPALLPLTEIIARPLENYVPAATSLPGRVDGIIVLGGALDARVSSARGQLALSEAAERMMAGAALAKRYPAAKLVLTAVFSDDLAGDFSSSWTPGKFFTGAEYVPGRLVFVGQSRSTYEDALLSLEAAKPKPGETWLLVTSAMHMPRALGTFQSLGWRVIPYPVDFRSSGVPKLSPSLDIFRELVELDEVVREWGALFIYRNSGRTQNLFPVLN